MVQWVVSTAARVTAVAWVLSLAQELPHASGTAPPLPPNKEDKKEKETVPKPQTSLWMTVA